MDKRSLLSKELHIPVDPDSLCFITDIPIKSGNLVVSGYDDFGRYILLDTSTNNIYILDQN